MEGKKKKQWTAVAAILMSLATLIYLINGLLYSFNGLKIAVVVMFGISAALYWYRYKTEKFEDD